VVVVNVVVGEARAKSHDLISREDFDVPRLIRSPDSVFEQPMRDLASVVSVILNNQLDSSLS
jgi:hypothetical protein